MDKESNILIGGSTVGSNFKDYLILKYSIDGKAVFIKNTDGEASVTDEVFLKKGGAPVNILWRKIFERSLFLFSTN